MPPGRARRRAAASSVDPIEHRYRAPCVLAEAPAVDEERRCAADTAQVGAVDVFDNAPCAKVCGDVRRELADVETELARVSVRRYARSGVCIARDHAVRLAGEAAASGAGTDVTGLWS